MQGINRKTTLIGLCVIMALVLCGTASAWWDGDWGERREIAINNTGGSALSYYQVYVNLTIDPVNATSLRVVNETASTVVPHWIESEITGNATAIYFNATEITGSSWTNETYYIYSDNDAVGSTSNISTTFMFGDDFPESSINLAKWNVKSGTCSVSNGYAQPYGATVFVLSKNYTATNAILHTKFIQTSSQAVGVVFRSTDEQRNVADLYMTYLRSDNTLKLSKFVDDTLTNFNSKAYTQGAATYTQHISFNGSDLEVDIWKGSAPDSLSATGDGTRSDGRIGFTNFATASEGELKVDYIFARKYTTIKPTSTLCSKEEGFSIISYAPSTYVSTFIGDSQVFNVTTSDDCQCRFYIDGLLVQTNTTLATDHTYTNISLTSGINQNFSAVVNTSTGSSMHTWWVTVSSPWVNTSYTNAKNITLLGADTQLTNYPYLVSIAKESAMQSDYDDLIFYDQPVYGGGNLIEFEIETYNATVATVWLNITTLPSAGKTVSVYYGNASVSSTENSNATWNGDYVGVWHLADDIDSYAGSTYTSTSVLDKYSCWGLSTVTQDPNNLQEYIITWQRLHTATPMRAYLNYSMYNITTETYSELDDIFNNSNNVHQGHSTWAYFGDKYHVAYAQTNGTEDFVADVNATTWAGLQDHLLTTTEPVVTPDLGWRTEPSYLKINDSSTWLLCPNRYDGGFAYVGYTPWDSTTGWGTWTKITGANDSDCVHIAKGTVKDNVIYLYYVTRSPYTFYMIKSSDYGATWSEPVNLGVASLDMHSTPVVHVMGDKFVLIYGTDEGTPNQMLMYRSDDGETFTNAQVVVSEACFVHEWAWLNDTHILLVYPDANSFAADEGNLDTGILNINNYLTFQGSGLAIIDATSNSNDGFPIGGASVSGIIGDAIDFSDDHIAINTNDFYDAGTLSWWQNSTSAYVASMVFQGGHNVTDSSDYCQFGKDGSEKQYGEVRSAPVSVLRSDADVGQTNESQHIVWTSTGSTTKCFVNGTEVSLTATDGANTGEWFSDISNIDKYGIGSMHRAAQQYTPFTGIIDQVELSKSVRSDDWIGLSYQMVVNSSYVAFGAEETYGATTYIPPTPTTLANTTGNFWVRHTYSPGSGNVTDSYNVSVNTVWHNTTPAYYNNTGLSAHAWSNITVYAYNSSSTGTLSAASISQDTQIPNNAVTITNTSGWSGTTGSNVYVDYDATDADSDSPTFSCNRTDLFADFSTSTGKGNWTSSTGTYYVDFGVSDGYGSTSNYTMTITVSAAPPSTYIPPTPTTLANTTGNFWVNHTWQAPTAGNVDTFYLIIGDDDGVFSGYNWAGTTWQSDSTITSGLGDVGDRSDPAVFNMSGIWYLIAGNSAGGFYGYNWTGSAWQQDSAINASLGDIGFWSTPTVFQNDSIWYLIAGEVNGVFYGYNWTGSAWQQDSAINASLGDIGDNSNPTVFQKDGTWYLISGEVNGGFYGYNWTGSAWQQDSAINASLTTHDFYSSPTIFIKGSTWYVITADLGSVFYGYNWTGSAWQSDSSIISGITTSKPFMNPKAFNMSSVNNVTDSYNVSVNTVWHNTTPAYYNNTGLSAHAWSNITVYAYNSSSTGTLSAASISQDTQIPNNAVTITNTSGWSGTTGSNVYVDYDATDADSDSPTFSCNRTDLFADFSTSTGKGNWTSSTGTYYVDFGVSDGYGSTSNYTMTITAAPTVPITITLLSFTPETVYTNYTGSYNMSYGIEHTAVGLDNSSLAFLFGLNYTVDSSFSNSIRPPSNNIADYIPALSVYGNIFRQFQRNTSPYLTWEFNNTITEGNIWKWGGLDYNSTSSLSINPVNSTYTYVNITGSHIALHQNMHYIGAMRMFASEKTPCSISKAQGLLFKVWDIDQINGRSDKYHITLYLGTGTDGTVPDSDIHIRMLNSSFNPLTDNPLTSPFSTYILSLSPAEWLDHTFTPHPNASYVHPVPINVTNLAIELDPTNYFYLYSDTVSPKPYILYVTNADSGTNRTFGETGVAWTRALPGGTTSAYAYTPNIFTTATRNYEELEVQLYGADNNGNWTQSGISNKSIGASQYPPSSPSFCHFEFAGHNDTSMDCTYRDNVTVWLCPGIDPDGGAVTNNLTLWTANKTVCVATINNTFTGATAVPVVFNTAPHYSTDTMYVMRCNTTDTVGSTTTRWTYTNFSLSPLGTSGAMVDGSRITFWGVDDVPALYTAISDPTAISLSGSTYTFHKAFHHSQYGDLWNVSSDIRIVSYCNISTPYYRLTGTDEVDGATILSWNETTGAPATSADEFRTYLYSDEYYSRINIKNSNLSYFGKGVSPYRGVYIQNGEGCVIDNNTLMHNGYGLNVLNGGNFSVTNNTITDPVGICLAIENTNGNVSVRDNSITSDIETHGIQMYNGGSGNEFINNTISGLVQSAFYNRYISDSIFRDNTLDSVQFGISLSHGCENITIIDNDMYTKMDVHGHPAWGIMILSGSGHNVSNNAVTAEDGYGIDLWQCANVTMINNSVTTNAGTHPDGGAFVDYLFEGATTGNIIHDPFDTSNSISLLNNGSDVRIENTDNTIFTEDSINHTYAYPTNFSLFADTQERFNITQRTMTATPATDRLRFWNLGWNDNVTFNASTDTAGNQVWFNITKATWADQNITVYRNGTDYYNSTADASGLFTYNYIGGWSERYFLVSPENVTTGTHQISNLHITTLVYDRIVWEWTNPTNYNTIMVYLDDVWRQNTTGTSYTASGLAQTTAYTIKLITVYNNVSSDPVTDTQITPAEQGGSGGGTPAPTPTPTATATPTITPLPDENVTENMSIIIEPIPEITNEIVMNDTISATVWHLSFDKHGVFVPQHTNIIACDAISPYSCRYYEDQKKFEIVIDGESPNPVFTSDQWVTFITRDGTRISQHVHTKVYNPLFYFTTPAISGSVGDFSRYFVHGDEYVVNGIRAWWLVLLVIGFIVWRWRRKP